MSKPKGKRSAYNFFIKACHDELEKNHPGGAGIVYSEFSMEVSDRWKKITPRNKKQFQDLAAKDKIRYEVEMKNYVPAPKGTTTSPKKGQKAKKDPNAPKHPLSSYFWFNQCERENVKEQYPGLTITEVAKELGRQWQNLNEASKAPYQELSIQDRQRYDIEMERYKRTGCKYEQEVVNNVEDDDEDTDMDDEDENVNVEEDSE